jgi:hypothetical protein
MNAGRERMREFQPGPSRPAQLGACRLGDLLENLQPTQRRMSVALSRRIFAVLAWLRMAGPWL